MSLEIGFKVSCITSILGIFTGFSQQCVMCSFNRNYIYCLRVSNMFSSVFKSIVAVANKDSDVWDLFLFFLCSNLFITKYISLRSLRLVHLELVYGLRYVLGYYIIPSKEFLQLCLQISFGKIHQDLLWVSRKYHWSI